MIQGLTFWGGRCGGKVNYLSFDSFIFSSISLYLDKPPAYADLCLFSFKFSNGNVAMVLHTKMIDVEEGVVRFYIGNNQIGLLFTN